MIMKMPKKVKWYDQILLNRPLKVVLAWTLLAIISPLLIYYFLLFSTIDLPPSDGFSIGSCLLPRSFRIPCGLGNVNQSDCHEHCCYDEDNDFCFHRFPSRFSYIMDREWSEDVILHPRVPNVPFQSQSSVPSMLLSVDEISSTHLSITFYDASKGHAKNTRNNRIENKEYSYEISSPELNVVINSSQGNIFTTARGPLIAADDVWEITFRVTEESMYGLGEIPLRENTVKILYNHDQGLSSVPLIFAKSNGSYHGLLIDVVEPTEVTILGEHQILVRSITRYGLKFHVFVGPKPEDVMRDVTKLIGGKKHLEYWMLGAHICSDIESETPTIAYNTFTTFLTTARTNNLPYESHCGNGPLVFNNDRCDTTEIFEANRGATVLRNSFSKKYLPHVSPYIRYTEPVNEDSEENEEGNTETRSDTCPDIVTGFEDILLHKPNNSLEIYKGVVGDDIVLYPDYASASKEFVRNLWTITTPVDGLVLENNWPLDESIKSHNETIEVLPYFSKEFETAFNLTPQWNISRFYEEKYFYTHNLYGNQFGETFLQNFEQQIPVWSSSHRMNTEVIVNRQNINATWTNLQRELIEAALGGVSGHWFWSTPICGDTEHFDLETQAELCIKWYMAGIFMPMIKIHSKTVLRHPLAFEGTSRNYILASIHTRLTLMPYLYTTLQKGPLLRPMFYQYPESEGLESLTSQFAVGEHLLIVPNLQPRQSHVHVWMPPGSWYELWSGLRINAEEGEVVTMTTTEQDFLTFIQGGSIIAIQKNPQATAEATRLRTPYTLIVAYDCITRNTTRTDVTTTECHAKGELFISDDLTIIFTADSTTLHIEFEENKASLCDASVSANTIEEINLYGVHEELNFDHHRRISVDIQLCSEEILDFSFIKLSKKAIL